MIAPLWPSSIAGMITTFLLMLYLTPLIETRQTFSNFQTPKLHSAQAPFAKKVYSSGKDVDDDTFNKFPQVSEPLTRNTIFRSSSSLKKGNVHDDEQIGKTHSYIEFGKSRTSLSGVTHNRNLSNHKHNVPFPPKQLSPYHFILRRDTRLSSATHILGIDSRNHTATSTAALSFTFHHIDNTADDRDVVSGRLYRHGTPARLTRGGNIIVRESDIAAIFRGVAYGMPTESALMHRPMDMTTPPASIGLSTTAAPSTNDPTPRVRVRLKLPEGHGGSEFQLSEGDVKFATIESEVVFPPDVVYPNMGFPTTIKLLIPPTYKFETMNGSEASTFSPETIWKPFENDGGDQEHITPVFLDPTDIVSVISLDDKKTGTQYKSEDMDINYPSSTVVSHFITTTPSNDLLNVTRYFVEDNSTAHNKFFGFLFRYSWENVFEYIDENIQTIWRIHVYSVTSFFVVISLVCFYRLVCQCRGAMPFFLHVSFYLVMFTSSFVRALIVLWNPYKGQGMVPEPVLSVLYIAGEPSVGVVMSSFIVLLLNIFYGMIVLPVIIAFFSAMEMATGVFLEFALGYFTIHVGDFSQNYLNTFSFIVGLSWNSIICIAYVILLSGKRFRQPPRGYKGGRKDIERGSADSSYGYRIQPVTDNCSYISCHCLIATFAQLFMIGLYVYIVLHPDELLSRPKQLKYKWVLFQIVGRVLEVLVYTFLLISVSKITNRVYKGRSVSKSPKRNSCCFCCCFGKNSGERSKRKGKGTGNIYTVNVDYDAVNHCPTDDFQLVWSRNANTKPISNDETPCSSKKQCSCKPKSSKINQSTKTKKLKTVRERNEKSQIGLQRNADVERAADFKETIRTKKSTLLKQQEGGIIFQESVELHNLNSQDYSKYQSVRGKRDLQNILQIELPPVDYSMYKYMGVTLPHAMEYSSKKSISAQTNSRSSKKSETLPSPVKELNQEVEDCARMTPRIPKQFWSPQHKPSKSFKGLPPLPLKAQAPINLPSLPPLNLKPVPPLNLPPLKLGQFSEKSAAVGMDDESLENLKRDQSFPEAFPASNYAYVPSREFIKDFMGCHPSPFSDRLSSADLATVSSFSEMRVDYLTDLSSADGNSIGSLSYFRASRMSFSNISDNINYY